MTNINSDYLRQRERFFKGTPKSTIIPLEQEANKLRVKRLSNNATIPTKAHTSDSGFDLYASEDTVIYAGETKVIPTDIAIDLPIGVEAHVRPRSGLTSKTKLRVQLGTIDNNYKGGIGIIADNIDFLKQEPIVINKGDKIAQLVVQYLPPYSFTEEVGDVGTSDRGDNGFGSTGV